MNDEEIRVTKTPVLQKRLNELRVILRQLEKVEGMEFQTARRAEILIEQLKKGKPQVKEEYEKGILLEDDAIKKSALLFKRERYLILEEIKRRGGLA